MIKDIEIRPSISIDVKSEPNMLLNIEEVIKSLPWIIPFVTVPYAW